MKLPSSILVTAANGNQGRLLVAKLLAADVQVRACAQAEASAAHLRALGVADVLVGDIGEPDVLGEAVQGVDKICHVGPTIHPRERDIGFAVVDAARAEAVPSARRALSADLADRVCTSQGPWTLRRV